MNKNKEKPHPQEIAHISKQAPPFLGMLQPRKNCNSSAQWLKLAELPLCRLLTVCCG
jgi:hypothetical protein